MKHLFSLCLVSAVLLLGSCTQVGPSCFPVYVWEGIDEKTSLDELEARFYWWKARGVTGVCIQNRDTALVRKVSAMAHAAGLEYHAWMPALVRGGMPHDWYAVNRLGQGADTHPAFVDYYRFLDPANPNVIDFMVTEYAAIASLPDVDYVQLDYIRYPDVILARGLWDKYGLDMSEEYPPADYCYCPSCVNEFLALTGIDIRKVSDPSANEQWAQFRCDMVTALVNRIAAEVHSLGKKVSADVFPGPKSYATWMVRQDWGNWDVDMLFAMNYNDFYLEDASWVGKITREEVRSAHGIPLISGLFICPDWRNKDKVTDPEGSGLLPDEFAKAVRGSLAAGAAGICLFTPSRMSDEHWEVLLPAADTLTTRVFTALPAGGTITIDGILDEPAWACAPLSEPFADIRGVGYLGMLPMGTRVKMLWDSENLYVAASLMEGNVTGSLTGHDSIIYKDNDFEIFLDPDADSRNYFEIEINALGTVMDLLMDRPYSEGGRFFLPWDCRGLRTGVHVSGSLNDPSDTDEGWTLEFAIPLASLCVDFQTPEQILSMEWRINFSRVEWLVPEGPEENWVWNPTGVVDMHVPSRWGVLRFGEMAP